MREWIPTPDGPHWSILRPQAAARGLGLEAAASLVLEAWLIERDLPPDAHVRTLLRRRALAARVEWPLPEASRVYLALLLRGRPIEPDDVPAGLPVPIRLLRRLQPAMLPQALAQGNLDDAVCWEVAAVAGGVSMAEWVWQTLAREAQSAA